jgi:hypothetical protein
VRINSIFHVKHQIRASAWAQFHRKPNTEPNQTEIEPKSCFFGFSVRFRFLVLCSSVFGFGFGSYVKPNRTPEEPKYRTTRKHSTHRHNSTNAYSVASPPTHSASGSQPTTVALSSLTRSLPPYPNPSRRRQAAGRRVTAWARGTVRECEQPLGAVRNEQGAGQAEARSGRAAARCRAHTAWSRRSGRAAPAKLWISDGTRRRNQRRQPPQIQWPQEQSSPPM